ncbi:MAG: hypothetical protein JXA20_09585 [Spirochaetes bacterium]|nr:hypothetical protein [Spirochaetota bacterium]
MNKQEILLYNSRSPEEYIENSLKCRLPSGRKAYVTRLWLEKKRFSIEDIKRARNRHPYWKKKKMEGSTERNELRRREHDYSGQRSIDWDEKIVMEFIGLNKKDRKGVYVHKDFELARHFSTSIPSIQHYRRKYNMVMAILKKEKTPPTSKKIYGYITKSEQKLRTILKGKARAKGKTRN